MDDFSTCTAKPLWTTTADEADLQASLLYKRVKRWPCDKRDRRSAQPSFRYFKHVNSFVIRTMVDHYCGRSRVARKLVLSRMKKMWASESMKRSVRQEGQVGHVRFN